MNQELELVEVEKTKTDAEKLSEVMKRVLDKADLVLQKLPKRFHL